MTVGDVLDKIKPWVMVKIVDVDCPSHSLNPSVIPLIYDRNQFYMVDVKHLDVERKLIIGISHFDFEVLKD